MNVTPITPITVVKVLKNVPLNSSYADTLTFGSVSAQTTFFMNKAKYTFNELTPIRLQNKMRLPVTADDIFDCNYIMFQNANFKNKWFYAFIKNVDFINVNECSVDIELDVMQSWMFDININPCFVEREHPNSDGLFQNLQVEPINYESWVNNKMDDLYFNDLHIIVCVTEVPGQETRLPSVQSNIYQGLILLSYPISNAEAVNQLIESYAGLTKLDSIVAIFMCPFSLSNLNSTWTTSISVAPTTLNGYTPRNKKLYNPQFVENVLITSSNDKQVLYQNLQTETNTFSFSIVKSVAMMPTVCAIPQFYDNLPLNEAKGMVINDTPMCSWRGNAFAQWLSQSLVANSISSLNNIRNNGIVGALTSAGGEFLSNYMGSHYVAKSVKTSGNANYATLRIGYELYQNCWSAEGLKMADDFMDVYGYATNQVKVPNITGRPYWNYVKTQNSKVTGSCGFDDLEKINSIFNNGITFWHGDYVGNYSLNNH